MEEGYTIMKINKMAQYPKIIDAICEIKAIPKNKSFEILKDRDSKFIFILLLKKYRCENLQKINEDFSINIKRSISCNFKKAKEKFFINKEFREMYFEVEKIINKNIS